MFPVIQTVVVVLVVVYHWSASCIVLMLVDFVCFNILADGE